MKPWAPSAIKEWLIIVISYALFAVGLTYVFGFFGMWSFGMTTVPDLAENRFLFPSLLFAGDDNVWEAIVQHALFSGIIYASLSVSVLLGYRAIRRSSEGE